jgi:uncharacterized protein YndB with AHSA1/START domain
MNLIDLKVSRAIAAAPEEVFDVWLDAGSPGGPWFGCERVILNPVVDGLFYHCVRHEGRNWAHYGRFTRLDRPHRIEHTWVSEATQGVESIVALSFEARGGQTEVTLRHSRVPDDPMGRRHEEGWNFVLGAIAARFSNRAPGAAG